MKKNILCAVCLISMCFTACVKLDTEPEDFIAPAYYYNTEDELNKSLVGVYNVLRERFLYSGANLGLITSFNATDEMFLNTSRATSNPSIYNYSFTDAPPDNVWAVIYRGIERANLVLANADRPSMDEQRRSDIIGQAKFLRAYFHFLAVQNFGAVPLRTAPTAAVSDVFNERVPAADVYTFIYNEMVESEALVSDITAYDHAGRVTKSAVRGILARVCLFMAGYPNEMEGMYEEALRWAEKVINDGYHELNPDYSQVFVNLIQDKYDTKESIWEVEFFTTGIGEVYTNTGSLGVILGIRQTNAAYGVGTPSFQVHERLYNKYEPLDLRRDWAIAPFSYQNNNQALGKVYFSDSELYNRYIGKFRREFEVIDQKSNQNGTNFPILRYSDVLLMAAEAENEINGPTEKAIDYINEVRRRAYGSGRAIKDIRVVEPGSGYSAEVPVTVEIAGGTPAAGLAATSAVATISDGMVADITLNQLGTFFSTVPNVTIHSDMGGGAVAEAEWVDNADADLAAGAVIDKDALRLAIQDERARELCFEGWRRLDLIRWGILIETMKTLADHIDQTAPENYKYAATAGHNIEEKHIFLPIPNWELSVNHRMYQNEGW